MTEMKRRVGIGGRVLALSVASLVAFTALPGARKSARVTRS